MNATRFGAWTRRRFGIATGSLVAALLGLAVVDQIEAKNKKKKRKRKRRRKNDQPTTVPGPVCRNLRDACTPGEALPCCNNLDCGPLNGVTGTYCCAGAGDLCNTDDDCCAGFMFACTPFEGKKICGSG